MGIKCNFLYEWGEICPNFIVLCREEGTAEEFIVFSKDGSER
jgi:hypothetical protein